MNLKWCGCTLWKDTEDLPRSDTTQRESPALATISCFPRIRATTAVVPLSEPGCEYIRDVMYIVGSFTPTRKKSLAKTKNESFGRRLIFPHNTTQMKPAAKSSFYTDFHCCSVAIQHTGGVILYILTGSYEKTLTTDVLPTWWSVSNPCMRTVGRVW